MSLFRAELHIHSCLSPCADEDMTPCNLAGMASLEGIGIAALTDHNTAANCPAEVTFVIEIITASHAVSPWLTVNIPNAKATDR